MPFTYTWDAAFEAQPADSEDINLGAQRIRNLKVAIHERLVVDHSWAGDANDGLHLHSEYIPQGVAPTLVNAADGAVYAAVVSGVTELFYKDSAGHVLQITKNGTLAPQTVTGNLAVTGDLAVTGGTTTNTLAVGNRISSIGGDGNFQLHNDGSNPTITFAPNTYIIWDGVNQQIAIVVNSVVEALFPP